MQWKPLLIGVVLGLPRLAVAADLGPLADLLPIGTAMQALPYVFGAPILGFFGLRAFTSYQNRDVEGSLGPTMFWIAGFVIGAVFLGVMVPALLAPIIALGATLE